MNGIVIIDKEEGFTSRDIVNKVSKIFETKKVGHTGTLDPLATGLLVVCINKATKLVDRITANKKEYIAECILGIETDTLDKDGKILKEEKAKIDKTTIIQALNKYKGKYNQQVPIYSAVKIKGKKLYEYARDNIDISLPYREVEIYDIQLMDEPKYCDNKTEFKFSCVVSKGTYVRSLIRDIAASLNTVGIMTSLRRTKQGIFDINDAIKISDLKKSDIVPIKDILDCKKIELTSDIEKKVLNGASIDNIYNSDEILFMRDNKEIALYKVDKNDNKILKIDKMFKGGII